MRDLYTRNTDRGRGGSKIPKIRLTSFVHGPLGICYLRFCARIAGQRKVLRKSWRVNCCETWSGDPCLNPRKNCASVLGARHTARARRTASTCTTLMTIAGDRSIGRFMARFTAMSGATLIYLRWKTASPPLFHPSIATLPEDEPRGLLRSVGPHLTSSAALDAFDADDATTVAHARTAHARRTRAGAH